MNKLTILALLAISGLLAGCSGMSTRDTLTSGGTEADGMASSGSMSSAGASRWYNSRQDISRSIYFGE